VAYDDMAITDVIVPIWNGQNALVPWQQGSASKSVDFLYPPSVVAASLGQSFDVSYGVMRGTAVLPSDVLPLTVSPLPDSELAKSTPEVTEAVDGSLDLNAFEGNAHVFVPIWPLAAVGQTVWLKVSGPNGVPTLKLLEGYPITEVDVANGIGRDISRAELEKYLDGDEMTVVCKVGFDGDSAESSVTILPVASYIIKKLKDSVVEDFTSVPTKQIYSPDEYVDCPTMTLTVQGGVKDTDLRSNSGGVINQCAYPGGAFLATLVPTSTPLQLRATLKASYSSISFNYQALMSYYDPSLTVSAFNVSGEKIGQWMLTNAFEANHLIEGTNITKLEFVYSRNVRGDFYIRQFTLVK
jgi:hypothetical protein